MALLLARGEVERLLSMEDAVEAVERAQVQSARETAVLPLRLPTPVADAEGIHLMMPAYLPDEPVLGFKSASAFRGNPERGLPLIDAIIVLLEPDTGRLLSVMDGVHITTVRTAAASAVATRALAREDAAELALIGAGVQARSHLEAMVGVRPIRTVRAAARSLESAQRFAEWARRARPQLTVEPVASAREAVEGADVICTVSTASEPVLRYEWLKPGCHVNGVGSHSPGAREIDGETMLRARVAVDNRVAALGECGDCMIPVAEGLFGEEHVSDEIGEILIGAKPGRTDERQITVYQSNGTAAQDVVTAKIVYERARARGIGSAIELG
ncbi:MAG TPA: ornithine cyclodeaminase family protein [Gaiellaceae bacterium]|nr:ornithine cyclodeaminase family protein [Gaiellaceae bacterium]